MQESVVPQENPFLRLDGKDGFHVTVVSMDSEISLHAVAYSGGELLNIVNPTDPDAATAEIALWKNPSPEDTGEAIRLHLVLDGIARYLTTGGSWDELNRAVARMRVVACGGLVFPGWHLHDSYQTSEGYFQHIFVHTGTTDAVLWQEPEFSEKGAAIGGFIDPKTLEEIEAEQIDDEWQTQTGAAGEGGSDVPKLSDHSGADASE